MPERQAATRWPQRPVHAGNLLKPLPAALAALTLLLALPGGVSSAWAATATVATAPPSADQDAATADLVQRLVLDRAASLARVQKKADEREQQLLDQLEGKDRTLRRALKEAQEGGRQTAQLRADLAGVTAERARLVEELTRRDTVFKGELAEYRRLVAELANSPNPERRQALERYADGDRVGAFATLKELTRIEEAAGEKAVKLRAAARYREQAALAADMKDRGDPGVTTLIVLAEWEAAAERDAGDFATWGYISRLRHEAGQTGQAIDAARELLRVAATDRERSVALNEMGDLLLPAGDLPGARRSFEESLQVARRLAAANPTSAEAQRDVSVSLDRLGDVQVAAGDLPGARRSFEESLQVARRLAAANPTSAQAQRDVSVSRNRLGDVQVAAGDLPGARRSFEESLQVARRLAAANPTSAQAQRDVSVSLIKLGDVQVAAGDLPGARRSFEDSLQVARRLAAANPTSAQAQRDVSVSLSKLGNVQVAAGDLPGARRSFEESLQMDRRLAAANPTSAEAQRDVVVSLVRLARLPDSGVRWSDALREMQAMQDRGVLAPSDEHFLEALRKIVAAEK
ncbi:hypothetical protein [Sphaerotilus sp.]|uniref:hypothetical protein n=1 Tax=Sphaerotilus sp. TaxID=2093942 RepID=UPI002ACEFE94|nr:hypothetical protein [Sphaerotilus sp.]MDZ7856065.1 hypothetical protein [Sphaerotilus sp.]